MAEVTSLAIKPEVYVYQQWWVWYGHERSCACIGRRKGGVRPPRVPRSASCATIIGCTYMDSAASIHTPTRGRHRVTACVSVWPPGLARD